MAQQQLAPDIVRKFYDLVYPHTRGRDHFKLSHGGRGGVSAVLELHELHPGDVVHSKAGRFAAADSDEVSAKHAVSLQLLHHLETQGILPNDWWRWPPDWQLTREPGVIRFTLICALLNMKEGYYTPRKNITTYGISSSSYDLAEALLDEMIAEGSVTQNSMQQIRLASLEEFNRRQQQLHQPQQTAYAVQQQPPQQPAYTVQHQLQQPAYAVQQPPHQAYVVSYANPEQVQQPAAGYTNALPVYTHQQQQVAYSYPTQTQPDYQQPPQLQVQQQSTAGAFDRRSAWQEARQARQAAVTAAATTAHAPATSARATSSHAAAVGASGGAAHATSSREYRATRPSSRDQQEAVHSSRYASAAVDPAHTSPQKRSSWVDERISQWQQQSQQPPPASGVTAVNSSGNAAAEHPFSMTSPRKLEQQRRRSSSQVPAFDHGDANGPPRVSTGQSGPRTNRHGHRSPSSPTRYAAAAGSPRRLELDPYRHAQQLPLDRIARQSPQRRPSGSSSDHRSGHQQTLPPLEPQDFDRFDRREPEHPAYVDHRVDQRHSAVEEQQYKRPRPSLDLQQRQQLQPGRWMEDHGTVGVAAGSGGPPSGTYSAGLKRDREAEHRSTAAHSGSSRGNSAADQSGSAAHHTRSVRQDAHGRAEHVCSTDRHHLGRDFTTTGSSRSRGEPVASPRFPRHTAAASSHHRDRSRSSSRHDQLPPSHKRPRHDLVHDRSSAGRDWSERGGAAFSASPRGLGQGPVERVSLHGHGSDRDRSAVREKVVAAAATIDKGRGVDRLRSDSSNSFRHKGLDRSGHQDRPGDRKHSRECSEGDRKTSSNDKDRHRRSKSMDRPRDKDRRSKERELDNSRTLRDTRSDRNSSRERRDQENREQSDRDRDRAKESPRDRSAKREEHRDDRGRKEQQPQQHRGKQTQQGQRDVAVPQQQLTAGTLRDSAAADKRSAAPPPRPVKLPDTTKLDTSRQLAAAVFQYISAAAPFAVDLSSLKAYFVTASSRLLISGACFDAFIARLAQEGLLEVFDGSDSHSKGTQYVRALHSSWSGAVAQQISLAAAAAAGSGTGAPPAGSGLAATTIAAVAACPDHAALPASTVAVPGEPIDAGAAGAAAPAAEAAFAAASPAAVSLTTNQHDNTVLAAAGKRPADAVAAAATRLPDIAGARPVIHATAAAAAEVHPAGDSPAGKPGVSTDARAAAGTTEQGADDSVADTVQLTAAKPPLHAIDQAVDAGAVAPVAAAGPSEVVAVVPKAGMQDSKVGQAELPEPAMAAADVICSAQTAAAAASAIPSGGVLAAPCQGAAVVAGIAVADGLLEPAAAAAAAATELAGVVSTHKADGIVAEAAAALAEQQHHAAAALAEQQHHAAAASNAKAASDRLPPLEKSRAAAAPCRELMDPMGIIDAREDSNAASGDEEMPDTVPASPRTGLTAANAAAAAVTDAALAAAAAALAAGVPPTAVDAAREHVGLDVDTLEARDALAPDAAIGDLASAGVADIATAADEPAGNGAVGNAPDDPGGDSGALSGAEEATPQAVAGKAVAAVSEAAAASGVAAESVDATELSEHDDAVLDLLPRAAAEEHQ